MAFRLRRRVRPQCRDGFYQQHPSDRTGRHHAQQPQGQLRPRYHHAGYVVESTNAIIRACDVAGNLGFADLIEHGPGRHGHTHSYYCYMRDPDGHRVELLLPGIQVIDIDDEPELFLAGPESTTNLWGLPPPRSWVEEATNFAGVTLRRLSVEGGPMTAEEYLAKRLPARVVAALDTVGF